MHSGPDKDNQLLLVLPTRLRGTVAAVPSKSDAHRALIAAAFSDVPTTVYGIDASDQADDIMCTIQCLEALGASITTCNGCIHIAPMRQGKPEVHFYIDESGTTLRLLVGIVACLPSRSIFHIGARLSNRPLDALLEAVCNTGANVTQHRKADGSSTLEISGPMRAESVTVDASQSSQFVSSFLFASALSPTLHEVNAKGPLVSAGYIRMTAHTLEQFGCSFALSQTEKDTRWMRAASLLERNNTAPSFNLLRSPQVYHIEGSWSQAAPWIVASAISEPNAILIRGLNLLSLSPDHKLIGILQEAGAIFEEDKDIMTLRCTQPLCHPLNVDIDQCPDLAPILSVAAAYAPKTSYLRNVGRLRLKESDRLQGICSLLDIFSIDYELTGDDLIIHGKTQFKSQGTYDSQADHRLVMSAAILGSQSENGLAISGWSSVSKSYPTFFDDMAALSDDVT